MAKLNLILAAAFIAGSTVAAVAQGAGGGGDTSKKPAEAAPVSSGAPVRADTTPTKNADDTGVRGVTGGSVNTSGPATTGVKTDGNIDLKQSTGEKNKDSKGN